MRLLATICQTWLEFWPAFSAISPWILVSTWKVSFTSIVEGLFPVANTYLGGFGARGKYLLRYVSSQWPYLLRTNTPSWRDCCQLLPEKVRLQKLPSFAVYWDIQDNVQVSRIPAAYLCDGMMGNAWSNNQPNFGCLASNNIRVGLARRGTLANENACPALWLHIVNHDGMGSFIVSSYWGSGLVVSHFIEAFSSWDSFSCIDINFPDLCFRCRGHDCFRDLCYV